MATQLLAVGTTAANSSDLVVAANSTATVAINDADETLVDPSAAVIVLIKDPAGLYFRIDAMDASKPAIVLSAGTYRFSRVAGGSCGVFSA